MKSSEPSPPRWAEAILRSLVRAADRESISGDLLEEYRESRRPALGAMSANAWYIKHVCSVLWHQIRPCVAALIVAQVLFGLLITLERPEPGLMALLLKGLWYGSFVQAPGVSLVDAVIYFWAGYLGSRRTGLVRTGMLTAGATSVVGAITLFSAMAIRAPGLLLAPLSKPFIFVIVSVLLSIALGYSVVVGSLGGLFARWLPPMTARPIRLS
jgi:hypothetical protein